MPLLLYPGRVCRHIRSRLPREVSRPPPLRVNVGHKLPSEAQICQCRVYMWSWNVKFCDGVSHESWFLGLGGLGKVEAIGKDDNQMLSNVPAYRASRGRQGQGHLEGASPSHPHALAIKQWNARYVSTDPDVREQGWCRYPQACDEPP